MKRERRDFDKEFKMMAVNLCYTGKSAKEIAVELGIRADSYLAKLRVRVATICKDEVCKLIDFSNMQEWRITDLTYQAQLKKIIKKYWL